MISRYLDASCCPAGVWTHWRLLKILPSLVLPVADGQRTIVAALRLGIAVYLTLLLHDDGDRASKMRGKSCHSPVANRLHIQGFLLSGSCSVQELSSRQLTHAFFMQLLLRLRLDSCTRSPTLQSDPMTGLHTHTYLMLICRRSRCT